MQIGYDGIYSCPVGQVIKGVGIEYKLTCNAGGDFAGFQGTTRISGSEPECVDQGRAQNTFGGGLPAYSALSGSGKSVTVIGL